MCSPARSSASRESGIGKTTVEDVARAPSGVSRATVYRLFPGGRDELLRETVAWEMARFFAQLGTELGPTPDFETFLERALPLARAAGPRARGAPEGARDRARSADAAHHRRAASRDLLHRGLLPAAPRARPRRRPARGRRRPGTLRRVRRPDGAVAHRLARHATTSRTPTRSAASSAASSSEACWPGPELGWRTGGMTMRQELVYCLSQ